VRPAAALEAAGSLICVILIALAIFEGLKAAARRAWLWWWR
jgi:hypothetical protein